MFISNSEGLTREEVKKTLHPYGANQGGRVDLSEAGKAAGKYLDENPDLLSKTGDLLDKAQY